jgi:hypothetical protein
LEIKQQQQLIGGRKIEKPRLMRADGGQGLNRLIGGKFGYAGGTGTDLEGRTEGRIQPIAILSVWQNILLFKMFVYVAASIK